MKNIILKIVFVFALLISMQQNCFAGFPIGQGRWLLVPNYTRYTANSYWGSTGNVANYTNNGAFQSNYLGLYGGFGISRDLDVVFNIPYISQRYTENGLDAEPPLQTTGDVTVGFCYYLNHYDFYKHLSLTGSLIFPTYPAIENTTLLPGFASAGLELKLGLAGTNTTTLKDSYYDLEAGIRSYFNQGGPSQFFMNATLGVPLDDQQDWTMKGTLGGVWSSSSITDNALNPTIYTNKNFNYMRATLAIGKKLDRHLTLWGAIFKDITGKSIGQGSGFSIYAVIKF